MKRTFVVPVTVMVAGRTYSEDHMITVEATTLGRAEAQAKRKALAGRKQPYYAYAHLRYAPMRQAL